MKYKRTMLTLCYAVYGMSGLILGMRTNIFLFIQRDYLDSYQHIASLVLISGICMQLTLYYTSHLIEKLGFIKVLMIGVTVSSVPLLLMFFVDSAIAFDVNYVLFMFGYGIVVLVLNLFVSHLVPERKGNALLMLHLYFALGALIGPKWISLCTDAGIPWQTVIAVSSIPLFLVLFLLIRINRQAGPGELTMKPDRDDTDASATRDIRAVLRDPFVWLFVIIFICSQIWEYGIGTWFVIFANKTKGLSSSEAAFYLTLFYASYPFIRILFSKIIHRLNLLAVLLGAFLCCVFFASLGMMTGQLLFYSLTGMGVALMYPGIMAAMQHLFGEGSTKKIGFITMAGGLVQYGAIWSVGLLSDHW